MFILENVGFQMYRWFTLFIIFFSAGAWAVRSHPDCSWGPRGDCAYWDHEELCFAGQFRWWIHVYYTGTCNLLNIPIFIQMEHNINWRYCKIKNHFSSPGSYWWVVGSGCPSLQASLPNLWLWQTSVPMGLQFPSAHLEQEHGSKFSQHCPLWSLTRIT